MERSAEAAGSLVQDDIFANIPVQMPAAVAERVAIQPARVAKFLGAIVFSLVVISILTKATGVADRIFGLDEERNVPTYFSTVILLICSGLLALAATLKKRRSDGYALQWSALSVMFLYLSMDELISFHEMTSPRIQRFATPSGPFYYASTLFTLALVVGVGIYFFRFLLHLPRTTATLFTVAAALYVGGALGMEMVGGLIDQSYGTEGIAYWAATSAEETMEMSGIVIFIYALLRYLAVELNEPRMQISRQRD